MGVKCSGTKPFSARKLAERLLTRDRECTDDKTNRKNIVTREDEWKEG